MKYSFIIFFLLFTACSGTITQYPSVTKEERNDEAKKQHIIAATEIIKKHGKKRRKDLKDQQRLARVAESVLLGGVEVCTALNQSNTICVYDFELTYARVLNAYADGKRIYITQRMLHFLKKDEDLAVILGHEYAHNILKHPQKMGVKAAAGYFAGMIFDGLAASRGIRTSTSTSKAGAALALLAYSSDFEREADYTGLYVAARAGYDISKAPDLWRRFSIQTPNAIYTSTTHPSNPERFISLGKTIEEIHEKQRNGVDLLPTIGTVAR